MAGCGIIEKIRCLGGIYIKRLIDFHLVHDNVKFELKDNIVLHEDECFEKTWECKNYSITLKMKTIGVSWSDITKRSYGNKTLRFTKLSNEKNGLWVVHRISLDDLLKIEDDKHMFSKHVEYNDFEFEILINVSLEIKNELTIRRKNQKKSNNGRRKHMEDNSKIQYICYNPRPYQGGSFSGK